MPQKTQFLARFSGTLDRVVYVTERGAHLEKPHLFIYFITIHNKSDQALTVKGRKWVVREANGEVMILEGEGVVGSFPHLKPGEKFSYNSCHTTHGAAIAEGSYLGLTDLGQAVKAPIHSFELVPE